MSTRITDSRMWSSLTPLVAELRPGAAADGSPAWVLSGCPPELHLGARLLTRNEAVTAMTLAELIAVGKADSPHALGFRAELGFDDAGRRDDPA